MFTSYGRLKYDPRFQTRYEPWWLLLQCDNGLSSFYRKLIEMERTYTVSSRDWMSVKGLEPSPFEWPIHIPYGKVTPSAWGAHISIVRGEEPPNKKAWKKYKNKRFKFKYDPRYINTNGKHWWFRAISPELEQIRLELGLTPEPTYIDYRTKELKVNHFHFTIGSNVEAPPSKRTKKKKDILITRKRKKNG